MKNFKIVFGITVLSALSIVACNSNNSTKVVGDTVMNDSTTNRMMSNMDTATEDFMNKAAMGGMMEIEAAKIAESKTEKASIKNFAALMIKDHSNIDMELKNLAASKMIMLPTELSETDKNHLDQMKSLSAKDFDKHYLDMMITDHAATVKLFEDATKSSDAEVKAFAEKTLKTIQNHYEMARKL